MTHRIRTGLGKVLWLLVLAIASGGAESAPSIPGSNPTILIAPFENKSEDRSLYWVSEGIADGLSREIRAAGGHVVDRQDRAEVREEMGVPTLSAMTLASQIHMAEELGAGLLVTGDFDSRGDTVKVRARLIEVAAGRTGPWITASGSVTAIVALQWDLFTRIRSSIRGLRAAPAEPIEAVEDGVPQSAYEHLLKSFLEDVAEKKVRFLRRSLELAPDYLRAKVELAQIYREQGQTEKALQTLSSIVTRHPALAAEAENLLAEIELQLGRAAEAESTIGRSLAAAETARGHLLLAKLALARGDRALARSEAQRSRALDPADPELVEVEQAISRQD